MKSNLAFVLKVALWSALSALFFYLFYIRYYAWRDCFNEAGRCYDPDGSGEVYTTGGVFWFMPACVFMLLGILCIFRRFRRGGER